MLNICVVLSNVEPLLHFDLHFDSTKKLWICLFSIIGVFQDSCHTAMDTIHISISVFSANFII